MSRFTVITPAGKSGRVYKSFQTDDQGVVTRQAEAPGMMFYTKYEEFSDFGEMCATLEKIENNGNAAIVRGDISAAMEMKALSGIHVRRTKYSRDSHEAGFQAANRDWVMIDIDKYEPPGDDYPRIDPTLHPEECIAYLIDRLPPYFRGVSCWWQFSASQSAFPGRRTVSAHLFYLLDRQVSDVTLRRWAESQRLTLHGLPIDPGVFDFIQPHYISPPRFVGMRDPLPMRSGTHIGASSRVVFDVPEEPNVPFTEGGNVHPLVQMSKLKQYLDAIGDDPGQLGFNDAIKSVVGRYFQLYGPAASDIPLKTALRQAIHDAPIRAGRPDIGPQSISHYLADDYLDPLIRNIREREMTEREAKRDAYKEALGRYVYVEDMERFLDTHTLAYRTKMGITDSHSFELTKLAEALLVDSNLRRVSRVTYKPGAPEFCEDYDPENGKTFTGFNRYAPPTVRMMNKNDAAWFAAHVDYICDGDGEAVDAIMDWMAHLVQHPEEKMNFGILLQGTQSIGKSALVKTLSRVLGPSNVNPNLPTSALMSNFTEWMSGKLLICIEEIRDWDNKFKIYNQMKDLITGETVRINPKGLPPFCVPNRSNFFCLTNYEDAIPMDDCDRRFIIHFSKAVGQTPDYYRILHERIEEFSGAVRSLLMERDISKFNPKGRAPLTHSKREYMKVSGTPIELYLRDSIEGELFPCGNDLIVTRDLQAALPSKFRNLSDMYLTMLLLKLGAKKLGYKRLNHGKVSVLCVRNFEKWESASEKVIAAAYRRPVADSTSGGYYQPTTDPKAAEGGKEY